MNEEREQTESGSQPAASIDEQIAAENLKIYQSAQKQKAVKKSKGVGSFLKSHPKSAIIGAVVALVVVTGMIGLILRPNASNTELAKVEEMPEIERKTDYSTKDTDGDGSVTQSDEDAEIEKITNDTGYSSYSSGDDEETDPLVKDELEKTGGDGFIDDNLGDTTGGEGPSDLSNTPKESLLEEPEPETTNEDAPPEEADLSESEIPTDIGTPTGNLNKNSFTIASWNAYYLSSPSNVANGAAGVGSKAQIIGFQELHRTDRRRAMRDKMLCASCAFSGYVKDYTSSGSSPASVAIIWRKDRFSMNSAGYYKVSSTSGGVSGKWIAWVKLRDKNTNKLFYVVNTHAVSGIESSGRPSVGGSRLANYVNHMNVLTAKIKAMQQENIPLLLTGDFNVNHRYDAKVKYKDFPFKRLGAIGVHSNWYNFEPLSKNGISKDAETHGSGSRLIDYIWTSDRKDTEVVSTSISSNKYGSDHRAAYLTVNLTP
ncbi:MAG: endonuclease/exonuclease/phosphatase family protein [Candidatus Saccharimonadaceae bacterium]